MMIDTLKKYDEIVALYGEALNRLANASDTEYEEAFLKLSLPESWQKILTPFVNMEIPFCFGLMASCEKTFPRTMEQIL